MAKLDLLEKKSIIGMIHTLALPGTMDYCGDMTKVIDRALADLHAMQNAGVDAVIVENFCDHPAGTKLEPEQMAALTAVATVVRARRPSRSALMRRSVIRWRVWPSLWLSARRSSVCRCSSTRS